MHLKAMKSGNALKLRKGAWGSDEDILLTKCIHKYGEGKWHLVPERAGLNRCRKSCRLRWLNYLRPNINRGDFGGDEVDLMMRLHRLLGNRWSLIAGRLPGRTANDVKNFWNTNIQKKFTTATDQKEMVTTEKPTHAVIKPLPRSLSKGTTLPCYINHMNSPSPGGIVYNAMSYNNDINFNMLANKIPTPATLPPDPEGDEWWKNLFVEIGIHGPEDVSSKELLMASDNLDAERSLIWKTDKVSTPATQATALLEDDGRSDWSDIWDFLNSD